MLKVMSTILQLLLAQIHSGEQRQPKTCKRRVDGYDGSKLYHSLGLIRKKT